MLNQAQSVSDQKVISHLQVLESEAIQILREAASVFEKPVLMFSAGKDSSVLLHLARKAFYPGAIPFPLLHINTTWKFREMIEFRDLAAERAGVKLIEYTNPQGIHGEVTPFSHGSAVYTDIMKTQALKQALAHHGFDAAIGGARRDEEKSRAKERVFSVRDANQHWNIRAQRPEFWGVLNGELRQQQSMRVFPLSNWTEIDVWQYILQEKIAVPELYFAKQRPVVERDGTLIMVDDSRFPLRDNEQPILRRVRFRTLGCYPLTGAIESDVDNVEGIIEALQQTTLSERQGRLIDSDSSNSMEMKKMDGYF